MAFLIQTWRLKPFLIAADDKNHSILLLKTSVLVNVKSLLNLSFLTKGMGLGGHKYHPRGRHKMHISNTSFAYLFWLPNNKKDKYPKLCMCYSDKTWFVGSGGTNNTHQVLRHQMRISWIPPIYISSDWLIRKAAIQSSVRATVTKFGLSVVVDTSITHMSVATKCVYLIP